MIVPRNLQETHRKGLGSCSRNMGWDLGGKGNNSDEDEQNGCVAHLHEHGVPLHLVVFSSLFLGVLQFLYLICRLLI